MLAPPLARRVRASVVHAADWLTTQLGPSGGWGYNSNVTADADSTAWAVMLLAALDRPVPTAALAFLQQHQSDNGLFRTYHFQPKHAWSQPSLDVSLSSASALLAAGVWLPAEGRAYWEHVLAPRQNEDGTFTGYWWAHPHFPTWLASRLWQQLDKPALPYAWPQLEGNAPFLLACAGGDVRRLAAAQLVDGSWGSLPILRVPPSHEGLVQHQPEVVHDARRVFTTVTVLRHLAGHYSPAINAAAHQRSVYGHLCDDAVRNVCAANRFNMAQQQQALTLFQTLTQHSLSIPNAWPAAQLSSLSMGQPLEFSATTAHEAMLRYTCEVSEPVLPASKRAYSGLTAMEAAADLMGCGALWRDLGLVWQEIGRSAHPVASGTRFWVWAGVAHPVQGLPTLKVYANTFHTETGHGHDRLHAILAAANIPVQGQLKWLCSRLDEVGFPQEIGFGLRGDGHWRAKIYYEFHGWRPRLITEIAKHLGFPNMTTPQLTPAIDGVLSAEFARKRRSGLSFSFHPYKGEIETLTTTSAFPQQLVPVRTTHERILEWLRDRPGSYLHNFDALCPPEAEYWRLFSLFTRTVKRDGKLQTAIYLRPKLG